MKNFLNNPERLLLLRLVRKEIRKVNTPKKTEYTFNGSRHTKPREVGIKTLTNLYTLESKLTN